jgi:hypothetical protein
VEQREENVNALNLFSVSRHTSRHAELQ